MVVALARFFLQAALEWVEMIELAAWLEEVESLGADLLVAVVVP
jgi:hypothetical protein